MRRATGWLVLAVALLGCDRATTSALVTTEYQTVDLTAERPHRPLRVTATYTEGRPGDRRFGSSVVSVFASAQHYLERCDGTDCAIGLDLTPRADGHPGELLRLAPGGAGETYIRMDGVMDDCPPRQPCTREIVVDLDLVGDELIEVRLYAASAVSVEGSAVMTPAEMEVELSIEEE